MVDRGYRVLNLDLRGHGDSGWSPTGAYTLDDGVADLQAILSGLRAPFALVGASLGGATAIHAAANGLRTRALVLVDIVPEPEPEGIERIVAFMRANPQGFSSLEEAAAAVSSYNPGRRRSGSLDGLKRNLRTHEDGRLYWHWDPGILGSRPDWTHRVVKASATALGCMPDIAVLLVRGLESDVVSDAGVATFRALVPHLQLADVAGAGHMVAGDRNDAFNSQVLEFLERCVRQ